MFRSRIFARYFISYVFLLITIFGVLTSIFAYVISFTRNTIKDSAVDQFEQISFYFGEKMSELKNMADLMYNNEYLTRYRLSSTDYMAINGIKELQKIGVSNRFIQDVSICYDDGNIYSMKGKSSIDVYAKDILRLDDKSAAAMREIAINSSEAGYHALYPSGGTEDRKPVYMLCTYPIQSYGSSIGMISFVVPSEIIKINLAKLLGEYGIGVRMLLPSGETFLDVNRSGKEDLFTGKYNNEYLYYSYTIDTIGFTLDVAMDSDRAFSYIRQMQKLSYIIISIVFALSLLLSYIFSKNHYKPIKMLNRMVTKDAGNLTDDALNEFDAIAKAMNHDQAENKKLLQKLGENSFILRQQACELLFSGVFQDEAHIKELIQLSGIRMEEPCFSVMMIVQRENERESPDGSNIDEQLCKRFGGYYAASVLGKRSIVLIVWLNDWDTGRKKRKQIADEVRSYFKPEDNTQIWTCFGRVYNEVGFISSSYREAEICIEKEALIKNNDYTVFFENFAVLEGNRYSLDTQDISRLIKHLKNKDLEKSIICFDEIMKKLNHRNLTPDVQKFHHYDLLHQFFHSFQQHIENAYISEIVGIDCLSADKFSLQMKKLFRLICNGKAHTIHKDSICEIINYIEDNYSKNDLSLSFLAREFHISQNYISKCFKLKTGENYIEYLSKLRIKKAYRLIRDTDLPINEIALKVGYLDSVNFTKKFKKAFRYTPSELRLQRNTAE